MDLKIRDSFATPHIIQTLSKCLKSPDKFEIVTGWFLQNFYGLFTNLSHRNTACRQAHVSFGTSLYNLKLLSLGFYQKLISVSKIFVENN